MAPEEEFKKRVMHKLTKRRKERHRATIDMPERLRGGEDADEDCTAPRGVNAYMNQSVFGMIAAAGSQADFNARFDAISSDDDDGPTQPRSQGSSPQLKEASQKQAATSTKGKHRQNLSDFATLGPSEEGQLSKLASGSLLKAPSPALEFLSGSSTIEAPAHQLLSNDGSVMKRMLDAKAELSMRPSFEMPRPTEAEIEQEGGVSESLAKRLMEIFGFDSPEPVLSEYPCWLLQSVLLQGYLYITTKHVCFYAYLPKKSNEIVKSGYLSKSGKRNPKYHRYWFRLKGDVLSYYSDPSDLYFPSGNIDLRYGISASVVDKDKGKDATYFTVVTHQRQFNFKADSIPSAKEWVKSLRKIIFRSHNEGNSVKISLPIENIIDVEDSQIVDFADTCKIRVIDNDETFAIDEYFFSFFSYGDEALSILKTLSEDTPAQHIPEHLLASPIIIGDERRSRRDSSQDRATRTIKDGKNTASPLEDSVKVTLSPIKSPNLSPRASPEIGRVGSDALHKLGRLSADLGRLSMDGVRRRSSSFGKRRSSSQTHARDDTPVEKDDSPDSYVHSVGEPSSSSALPSASDETHASASQILKGSDVFKSPTIQRPSSPRRPRHDHFRRAELIPSPSSPQMDGEVVSVPSVPPEISGDPSDIVEEGTSASAPTLQSIVKAGSYPLQRAAGFAGYLNRHSKRMSNLLATESMGYVEKVSGMWKGGKKHYDGAPRLMPDDEDLVDHDNDETGASADRFREHFALPLTEKLQASYFGYLHRVLPLYGKVYISSSFVCFRSLLPGTRTKLILPLIDIENVDKEKGFRFGYSGLVIVIKGHEELFFEFSQADARDDCAVTLHQNLESVKYLRDSGLLTAEEKKSADVARAEHKALQMARNKSNNEHELKLPTNIEDIRNEAPPVLFDDPRASILNFKPTEPLRITCLTIGSRGDVQPYIALCKGLMAEGHKPRIATHLEFKSWIESYGIEFKPVDGDPAELMRICVENGMFTYSFLKEASSKFRGWIDDLLSSGWRACQGSDILIESPSAMGGIHIAEALEIPYFRAFSMPWTRTRAYPHAFAVPEHKMGGAYNYITYVMFDNVFWKAIAGQVNRWRMNDLHLPATSLEKMQPNKVPFLYSFSPSVVVPPLDYSDWIRVTGYWFLDEGSNWTPPEELAAFIKKARDDGKKLVYVGFGSIVVQDSAALTNTVIKSVLKADVRCILSKGWSDRLDKKDANEVEAPLPPEIYQIKAAPHDWLFTQIDAVAHHGGAGTTGASLRAGLPTIIKPFFGDQFFFGSRVEDLGIGIYLRKLNVSVFARALWEATHSERMIVKARVMGEQIRKENGVDTAIQSIYRDLEYAKSLLKGKGTKIVDDPTEESEESWTFVGDDNDPELIRRIHDWEAMAQSETASNTNFLSGSEASGHEIPAAATGA